MGYNTRTKSFWLFVVVLCFLFAFSILVRQHLGVGWLALLYTRRNFCNFFIGTAHPQYLSLVLFTKDDNYCFTIVLPLFAFPGTLK